MNRYTIEKVNKHRYIVIDRLYNVTLFEGIYQECHKYLAEMEIYG